MKKTKSRSFAHINRRVHLYLALVLLPWFFMYGFSALAIHHGSLFKLGDDAIDPPWNQLYQRQCDLQVSDTSDLKRVGSKVMKEAGLIGQFKVTQPSENRIEVERTGFWSITRLIYGIDTQQLRAEQQSFSFQQFLVRLHVRGGIGEGSRVNDLWAVMIDVVSIAILIWVASGFYMWWKAGQTRRWGIIAIVCGIASFGMFLYTL